MLRCRKCRKTVADSTCLLPEVEEAVICSIYHLDLESVPDWIYSTVEQAQWTMGKLNCPTCNARLGGFNFVQRSLCPCGIDNLVHLSKSRVDSEHPHRAVIFYSRTAQTGWTSGTMCAGGKERQETGWISGTTCAGGEARQETGWTSRTSCALLQGFTDSRAHNTDMISTEESSSIKALTTNLSAQHFGAPKDHATSLFCVSKDSHLPWNDTVDLTEVLRAPQRSPTTTKNPEELPPSRVPQQLNRKEKNRLKSLRRKERRRERWLHSQQEQEQADVSESEDSQEGLICAVCLDVYYSPLCCQPCQHVFCEPCLRTLAKNHTSSTACPLCRTTICHTSPHEELSKSVKTFFPKAYSARKQSFQNAPCSKWPLPRSNRHLHMLWGHQRSTASWTPSLFSLETLHLTNMADRGSWLSDIALVIICFHSVNWVLVALLFSLFCYYLFC